MRVNRIQAALPAALAAMFLLGCSACADRAAEEPQTSNATQRDQAARSTGYEAPGNDESFASLKRQVSTPELSPTTEDWDFIPGETDGQNRYQATVLVVAIPPSADRAFSFCSGVLVAPQLVLTAGNCVCSRQREHTPEGGEQTVIDATSCAAHATITIAAYEPSTATQRGFASTLMDYNGEVRPHPALKIVLDKQGNIASSEADLAVIELAGPLEGHVPPLELADVELRVNESLVMVGYDAVRGALGGKRRFHQYHVTKVLDEGARALFDQPKRHVYKGDSGGPCIRETTRGMILAGILNRSLGAEASFTSTYHYRDWIHQEMQRAAGAAPR